MSEQWTLDKARRSFIEANWCAADDVCQCDRCAAGRVLVTRIAALEAELAEVKARPLNRYVHHLGMRVAQLESALRDVGGWGIHYFGADMPERWSSSSIGKRVRSALTTSETVVESPWTITKKEAIEPTHEAADAFWKYWRENGDTHKHGYYESTWGAINAALNASQAKIGGNDVKG